MFRCPGCRTRRATWGGLHRHIEASGCEVCRCGGYHYPHRPGSPCCKLNPNSAVHDAMRSGATDEDLWEIQLDTVWHGAGRPLDSWPERKHL